jgi:signal peptidase II
MNKWMYFVITLVLIILDQVSKHWVVAVLHPYQPNAVIPMLNVTLAYNSGAAFSFLSGTGAWHRWFFTGFNVVMSAILIRWICKTPKTHKLQSCALSMILAGALGNLIDRLTLGSVIDFIDVYYTHYHWPVFNIADSVICIGAFLLLIDLFLQDRCDK